MSNNHFRNLPVPFLSQRQNDYLWYKRDKDNFVIANQTPVSMDCRTCNITSVMMVMKYLGLTGIERTVKNITFITPSTPKEFLTKYFNHEYDSIFTDMPTFGVACLEDWNNLKKIASDIFGADCTYDSPDSKTISLETVKDEIAAGYPVCISIGIEKTDATTYKREGHVVVVRGFTKIGSTEYIILNDPWGSIVDDEFNVYEINGRTSLGSYFYDRDNDCRTNGDNVIIKLSDFKGKLVQAAQNSPDTQTYFHNVMTIHAPLWNFPDGTADFTTEENQAEIYHKARVLNGGYPINKNNVWHTGIHLAIDGEIHSIGPASLIAVRNSKVQDDSFDKSFVLLEHKTKLGSELKSFYSLYMHLKHIELKDYVRSYFSNGKKTPYPWLNQLLNKILCFNLVVKNLDSDNSETGQINEAYSNIKLYKVTILEDGTLIKENTASSTKLGRRCLINPLPIKNQKIHPKLLDPEKYNDEDFKSELKDSSTYIYNNYVYFLLDGNIYATLYDKNYFEYGIIFYKQLLTTSKQIYNLYTGEIVTFSNGEDYIKTDVTQNLKATLKTKLDNLNAILQDRFKKIANSNHLQLNIYNPFLDIIDLCSFTSNMCCNMKELKNINELFKSYFKDYLKIYEKEFSKFLIDYENKNSETTKTAVDKRHSTENIKNWKTYFQENCKLLIEEISRQLNTTITIPTDFADSNINKNGEELAKTFKKEINKTNLSNSNKIIVYETLILWLEKISADKVEEFEYFKNTDACIKFLKNEILSEGLKKGLLIELYKIYDGTFTFFLENQIEIGKNEIIGNCGKYETLLLNNTDQENYFIESQIHFEIFSEEKNILNLEKEQTDLDDDILYNPQKCIEKTKDYISEELQKTEKTAKYLDDNMLKIEELKYIYNNSNNSFLEDLALNIKSPWGEKKINTKYKYYNKKYIELTEDDNEKKLKQQKKLIEYEDYYDKYIKPFMWFNEKVFNTEHFKNGSVWYYHPLYFIEKLVSSVSKSK